MASSTMDHQPEKTESLFLQAWKSVKKHFPNSCVEESPDACSSTIAIHPIPSINLIVKFCFNDKYNLHQRPDIDVRSGTLSDVFLKELEKILHFKCANLSFDMWHTLGDEMETVMQCVEVRRDKKMSKKNRKCLKGDKNKKASSSNFTVTKIVDDAIENVSSQDEMIVSLGAVPGLHLDWNSYCKEQEKKPRPNYFIAIRIHNKIIASNISKMQDSLVSKEDLLAKGVIPSDVLHLTLCNLGLDSACDLLSAMETMNRMKPQLQEVLPKTPFIVHGVSKFYNRAIYAKVKIDQDFHKFRNLLIENLGKAGVEFREDHEEFNPHVTVVKVRRPERKAFGTRNIEPTLYSDFVDVVHGEQVVDSVYLCAMGGQKRRDGFYVTACELHFTSEQ